MRSKNPETVEQEEFQANGRPSDAECLLTNSPLVSSGFHSGVVCSWWIKEP
jgi:hypothetical protein